MRRLAVIALVVLAGSFAAGAAGLLSLLPATGTAGWSIVNGADAEVANSAGLYRLYDGAAPQMMQAGIRAAAQRIYKRGNRRLTVDVYRFTGWQQAKSYYRQRRTEVAGSGGYGVVAGVANEAVQATCGRTVVCYLWRKQYCVALSVNGSGTEQAAAIKVFAAAIAGRIGTR